MTPTLTPYARRLLGLPMKLTPEAKRLVAEVDASNRITTMLKGRGLQVDEPPHKPRRTRQEGAQGLPPPPGQRDPAIFQPLSEPRRAVETRDLNFYLPI